MTERDHPVISLRDWESFREDFSPFLFERVITRQECKLWDEFVPNARGAAIASLYLLKRVGYKPGMKRLSTWRGRKRGGWIQRIASDGARLVVRSGRETRLWTVERIPDTGVIAPVYGDILVFIFGSTPIYTRTCEAAMRLADYCHKNGPPSGLRWVKTVP